MTPRLPSLLARVARLAPREQSFSSRLRGPAVAARVGLWLGIAFGTAFVTGLLSHYAQDPTSLLHWPTRPVWGYRVTQGLHVAAGTASIPLLAIKLWTVYPKLFAANPLRPLKAAVLNVLERGSIALLVSAGIFELATGLSNTAQWYPWAFNFRAVHFAVAWIAVGSLLVHVAVKLPVIRAALTSPIESGDPDRAGEPGAGGSAFSRRGLARTEPAGRRCGRPGVGRVGGAGAAEGLGLRRPVRRRAAGHPDQPVGIRGRGGPYGARRCLPAHARLRRRRRGSSPGTTCWHCPQTTATPPDRVRRGVERVGHVARADGARSLLDLVGAPAGSDVLVVSLRARGAYGVSRLPAAFAVGPADPAGDRAGRGDPGPGPRLPVPDHRARTGPASCRPSGSPVWRFWGDDPCRADPGRRCRWRAAAAYGVMLLLSHPDWVVLEVLRWLVAGVDRP